MPNLNELDGQFLKKKKKKNCIKNVVGNCLFCETFKLNFAEFFLAKIGVDFQNL